MTFPLGLNLLDVLLLAFLALFTIRGAIRGFLQEVTGLVGILLGLWLAGRYYTPIGELIQKLSGSSWSSVIAYVAILCATLIVISVISRILHKCLKMAYADWINHIAGAIVGCLKGFALSAIVVALLGMFMSQAPFVKQSQMVPIVQNALTIFKNYMPPDFFQRGRIGSELFNVSQKAKEQFR